LPGLNGGGTAAAVPPIEHGLRSAPTQYRLYGRASECPDVKSQGNCLENYISALRSQDAHRFRIFCISMHKRTLAPSV